MSKLWQKILVVSLFAGCATPGMIKTNKKAQVYSLTSDYVVDKELGSSPVKLPKEDLLLRLLLTQPGVSDEVLFLLFPHKLNGDLQIDLSSREQTLMEVPSYRGYMDQMLRTQRYLMRNQLVKAKEEIDQLKKNYKETYAYFILLGSWYAQMGDKEGAYENFKIASDLYPQDEGTKSFVKVFE